MAFIEIVPPSKARGETRQVYDYMAEVGGDAGATAKIVQMFSLRAGSMRRMIRSWELAMWVGDEPRDRREVIAAAVSRYNSCAY